MPFYATGDQPLIMRLAHFVVYLVIVGFIFWLRTESMRHDAPAERAKITRATQMPKDASPTLAGSEKVDAGPPVCEKASEESNVATSAKYKEMVQELEGLQEEVVHLRKEVAAMRSKQRGDASTVADLRKHNGSATVGATLRSGAHLTVVMMSYPGSKRFHRLEATLKKVSTWPFVKEVLLVWNGGDAKLPESIGAVVDSTPKIRVLPQTRNSVDNRWRIADEITTEAVLNMDDDVDLKLEGADCLLHVWDASPFNLVAVDVRAHFPRDPPGPFGDWGYGARDLSGGFKQYSIALPRVLMAHKTFFALYDDAQRDPTFRRIVDELLCDDIAFNFVVSNYTRRAPVYAKAKFVPFSESHDKTALTHQSGMKEKRQRCVNELSQHFGYMSLVHHYHHVMCSVDG